jgi:hypothetical protein
LARHLLSSSPISAIGRLKWCGLKWCEAGGTRCLIGSW